MATFTHEQLKVVGHVLGVSTPILHGPVTASETFTRGAVIKAASGRLVVATDAAEGEVIVGVSNEAATGLAAGTAITYTPFVPGLLIEANLSLSGGSFTSTAADADLFLGYSLGIKNGLFFLDEDVKSTDAASGSQLFAVALSWARGKVSGVVTQAVAGDIDARVLAVITNSAFGMGLSVTAT